MFLQALSLSGFRNLSEDRIAFARGLNLFVGDNGQGKTALLEAVHFLCLAHSQRAGKEKECIAWDKREFVLRGEGVAKSGLAWTQSVAYEAPGCRVKVNGKESKRLSDLLGAFHAVSFAPEDVDLVRGAPQGRRRFLDVLLAQQQPDALEMMRLFQASLKQRQAALAQGAAASVLDAYEIPLARAGAEWAIRRERLITALKPKAQASYALLSAGQETLGLRLTQMTGEVEFSEGNEDESLGKLTEAYARKLRESRQRDAEDGGTSAGPHRDDLMIFLRGKAARAYGSQGQKRTVALSLKWAAADLLRETSGLMPILLLDDVFADLDPHRQAALGKLLSGGGQAFLATPRRADAPFEIGGIFHVQEGRIRAENPDF